MTPEAKFRKLSLHFTSSENRMTYLINSQSTSLSFSPCANARCPNRLPPLRCSELARTCRPSMPPLTPQPRRQPHRHPSLLARRCPHRRPHHPCTHLFRLVGLPPPVLPLRSGGAVASDNLRTLRRRGELVSGRELTEEESV